MQTVYHYDLKQIGTRIQESRERKRIKRNELASEVGIAYSYLSQIEVGTKSPSIDVLMRICYVLKEPMDYIVAGRNLPMTVLPLSTELLNENPVLTQELLQIFYRANVDAIKLINNKLWEER